MHFSTEPFPCSMINGMYLKITFLPATYFHDWSFKMPLAAIRFLPSVRRSVYFVSSIFFFFLWKDENMMAFCFSWVDLLPLNLIPIKTLSFSLRKMSRVLEDIDPVLAPQAPQGQSESSLYLVLRNQSVLYIEHGLWLHLGILLISSFRTDLLIRANYIGSWQHWKKISLSLNRMASQYRWLTRERNLKTSSGLALAARSPTMRY